MKVKTTSQLHSLQIGLKHWKSNLAVLFFSFFLWLGLLLFLNDQKKGSVAGLQTDKSEPKESIYHLACPFSKSVYQVNQAKKLESFKNVKAVIVPHHLLARDLIANSLAKIEDEYQTIVLIGPNHREVGRQKIQTSYALWKTKFGNLEADYELIGELERRGLAKIGEDNFETEHSVCSLASFIKIYFPKAKILPLVLKTSTSINQTDALAAFLAQNCQDCLFIASVDFSHQVSQLQAEENDKKSAEILSNLDKEKVNQVICDSQPTLQVLLSYLEKRGVKKTNLVEQSDSAQITGQGFDSVTSYLGMIFK